MQNDKLLNCPFCGGEAKIHEDYDIDICYQVMCQRCFCKTKFFATTKSAVITWNTRKPMERIVEQLEEKKWGIHDWRDRWRNEIIDECIGVVKGGVDNAG